jgi:hypothetical protein
VIFSEETSVIMTKPRFTEVEEKEQLMGEEVHPAKAPLPREPNVSSGGKQEPGGLVPPYEGHKKEGPSDKPQAGEGSMAGPREVSEAEREGVSPTDTTAASPLGVGVSTSTQGNERMFGRSEEAQQAEQREAGVGGETPNIDPDSPPALTGDQGG